MIFLYMEPNSLSFRDLGLSEALLSALEQQAYAQPYPIQTEAIPVILQRKDLLGIAPTGSGKTASYVLPILHRLQTHSWTLPNRHIAVLILVPTRELAQQVQEVCETFGQALPEPVKSMAVYGGVSINPQMIQMQGVQILVATPGRLLDLLRNKALHLSDLKVLVLDEADKLLNQGFQEEMNELLALMPQKRQNLLFSATLNPDLKALTQLVLFKPTLVHIQSEAEAEPLIHQRAFRVVQERKGPFLRFLIQHEKLSQVLIFTSSTRSAERVADKLQKNGFKAATVHGKKSQGARRAALEDFKAGRLPVLVATDLLGRGIDISGLPCVINYDLPRSPKDFIHRIGRTGRADQTGTAYTLVMPEEQSHFKVIQKKMGRWITLEDTAAVNLHGF